MEIVYVLIAVLVVLLLIFIGISNKIARATVKIEEASSGIDVALTKRYDVLTKAIDVVKAFAKHEKDVIFSTIEMRKGMSIQEKNEANKKMDTDFAKINALAENYPDLRSSENYVQLQKSITDVEEHLQAARRLYNSNVASYNELLVTFPSSLVASMKGCKKVDFFETENKKKEDVKIDL